MCLTHLCDICKTIPWFDMLKEATVRTLSESRDHQPSFMALERSVHCTLCAVLLADFKTTDATPEPNHPITVRITIRIEAAHPHYGQSPEEAIFKTRSIVDQSIILTEA